MRSPSPNGSNGRTVGGRFTAGNRYGTDHRFATGQCGNPWGRPVSIWRWVQRFCEAGLDEPVLRQISGDPDRPPHARIVARRLLVDAVAHRPIPGIDPVRARRLFYRTVNKNTDDLSKLVLDEDAEPDHREAARLRLKPRP